MDGSNTGVKLSGLAVILPRDPSIVTDGLVVDVVASMTEAG
jgi:hypothetical protein